MELVLNKFKNLLVPTPIVDTFKKDEIFFFRVMV